MSRFDWILLFVLVGGFGSIVGLAVWSQGEETVVVSVKTVDTYTEGLYLDTDHGMYRCCDDKCHSDLQDRIILKHNALVNREPKRLTICREHREVLSVDFVGPEKVEKKTDREIVYKQVTPEGINLSAVWSSVGSFVAFVLVVLLGLWGGYRMGRRA